MKKGQTLVILLVFIAIATTIISSSVVITMVNSTTATKFQQSQLAYYIAETGIENTILRLIRDPSCPSCNGEILPVGNGTATVTVSGTTTKIITSIGKINNFIRIIQVTANLGNTLTILTWKEVQ